MPTKFIVVTGGVLSGLGKGIAAASIGNLISSRLKVTPVKCEGYLNIDPGTMNPLEHGEVFVLDDGEEADMDFGHYERFLNISCKAHWNITMGKVYQSVFEKERRGDYLGTTVQMIPHVTDQIKDMWLKIAEEEKSDVLLIEIGGTVGDIETNLHVEAARQLKSYVGRDNIIYVHLTYIPVPTNVNEQKSKPTQQSINLLRSKGIQPDIIIGRCEEYLTDKVKRKIGIFCDVDEKAVISGVDVDNVYKIPLVFEQEGINEILHRNLRIYSPPDLSNWKRLVNNLDNPEGEITIGICGKYTKLEDSYASIIEALTHSSAHTKHKINIKWIETTDIEKGKISAQEALEGVNGVIVPGGFGSRGTEGKIKVIEYVRTNNIPFLGICLGLQLAAIEFARNVCNLENANSTEFDKNTPHQIAFILPGQEKITNKGGTLRLGAYPAILKEESLANQLYGEKEVSERHRHRYEVNPEYHEILQRNGLNISGLSPDGKLAEFIELSDHPYFISTQAHPELKSRLEYPAPLFLGLVNAGIKNKLFLKRGLNNENRI